jgi:hypothetical protein
MLGNEPTGQWMRNSAVDNPQFLATTIANFLGWKNAAPGKSYAEARPLVLDKGEYFFQSQCNVFRTWRRGAELRASRHARIPSPPDRSELSSRLGSGLVPQFLQVANLGIHAHALRRRPRRSSCSRTGNFRHLRKVSACFKEFSSVFSPGCGRFLGACRNGKRSAAAVPSK